MATRGIRPDDLRKQNRAMVIAAVRRARRVSRTELSAATALSPSTISAISADLIEEGVLTEIADGAVAEARRGRPKVLLELQPDAAATIAVVLTLDALSASLIDYSGRTVAHDMSRPSTLTLDGRELIDCVAESVRRVLKRGKGRQPRIMRMTMAVQGITDAAGRRLRWSPMTPHRDIEFASRLEEKLGFPVSVQNDCNMIAVALHDQAPDRYSDNFLALLLSNGIGMGMYLGGRLFTGTHSSAGEFGHMIFSPQGARCLCGRHGCIEAYAGNYAIHRRASGLDDQTPPSEVVDEKAMLAMALAARNADGPERDAFRSAGQAIGYGLGNLFALIDPAPVAVVGPGAAAFDLLEPAIRRAIAETVGGEQGAPIGFDLEPEEAPLVRAGCAAHALHYLDSEVLAAGAAG